MEVLHFYLFSFTTLFAIQIIVTFLPSGHQATIYLYYIGLETDSATPGYYLSETQTFIYMCATITIYILNWY